MLWGVGSWAFPPPPMSTAAGKAPEPAALGGVFGFGLGLKPIYAAIRDQRMAAMRRDGADTLTHRGFWSDWTGDAA